MAWPLRIELADAESYAGPSGAVQTFKRLVMRSEELSKAMGLTEEQLTSD